MALTPVQRTGAALEAAEADPKDIAIALDVNKKTVVGWRKNEEYLAEVDRLGRALDKELEPLIKSARVEVLEGGREALETLKEGLQAVTKDGRPAMNLRVQAAAVLASYMMKLIGAATGGVEGNGDDNSTNFNQLNNFTVVMGEDGRAEVQPTAIDSTAVEVD
jgi:hypothetical protein